LYSFKETFEGAVPYRDYFSQNGPLMPYYYGIFYHLFGVSIQSTLTGYYWLIFLTGICVYFIFCLHSSAWVAMIGALWYWAYEGNGFAYTYNHNGGLLCVMVILFLTLKYLKEERGVYIYWLSFFIFLLALIRPNIAVASMIASMISIGMSCQYQLKSLNIKYIFQTAFPLIVSLLLAFLVYKLLTNDLPGYVRSQELAYAKFADWKALKSFPYRIFYIILTYYNRSWITGCLFMVTFISGVNILVAFFKNSVPENERRQQLIVLGALGIFFVCLLGEFYFSELAFRFAWAATIFFVFTTLIIDFGSRNFYHLVRLFLIFFLLLLPFNKIINNVYSVHSQKVETNYLSIGANSIYLSSGTGPWIKTVKETTLFLKNQIPENESFFCLPYCPLYYFLTDKTSPSRILVIYGISLEQERQVIRDLEDKHVNYVVIENRAYRPDEPRVGVFNKTYAFALAEYIQNNFSEIASFGPWDSYAGWVRNHAVKIYRRNGSI